MKREGNYFVFEDGRKVYAYDGILGITELYSDSGELEKCISHGYDGYITQYEGKSISEVFEDISKEHKLEICDYMIHEWLKLKFETVEKIKGEKDV